MHQNYLSSQNITPYAIITNNGVSVPVLIHRDRSEQPYEMVKLEKSKMYSYFDPPGFIEFQDVLTKRLKEESEGIHRAEFTTDFINLYEIVSTQIFFPAPQNPKNIKFLTLEEMGKWLEK